MGAAEDSATHLDTLQFSDWVRNYLDCLKFISARYVSPAIRNGSLNWLGFLNFIILPYRLEAYELFMLKFENSSFVIIWLRIYLIKFNKNQNKWLNTELQMENSILKFFSENIYLCY